jgi:hypothetical protein
VIRKIIIIIRNIAKLFGILIIIDTPSNTPQKQIFIKDKIHTYPDAFIEPNICIYLDGDYWHRNRKNSDLEKLNMCNDKNILLLTGSPRRYGNSDRMAEAFTKGALDAGHNVMLFNAGRKEIGGCKACKECWSKGEPCIYRDDFDEVAPLLEEAEVILFATPLYWALLCQVPSVFKSVPLSVPVSSSSKYLAPVSNIPPSITPPHQEAVEASAPFSAYIDIGKFGLPTVVSSNTFSVFI